MKTGAYSEPLSSEKWPCLLVPVGLQLFTPSLTRWARGGFRYKDDPSNAQERYAQTILRITGSEWKYFLPTLIKKVRVPIWMFIVYESDHFFFKAAICIRKGQDTHVGSAPAWEALWPAESLGETRWQKVPLRVFQGVTLRWVYHAVQLLPEPA